MKYFLITVLTLAGTYPSLQEPAAPDPVSESSAPRLVSWAMRVHDMDAMKGFYGDVFATQFEGIDVGGVTCQFGEAAGMTIKLVPLRAADEFEEFPLHQPGIEVDDVDAVIAIAVKYGGRQEGTLQRVGDRVSGAIRDPDGNTIELYSRPR